MEKREITFGRPCIDDVERRAVQEVLKGFVLTHGPVCQSFEKSFEEFLGGGKAVTTSSCMASLHLANIHFGFKPGDEVIIPAQTHVATAHATELVGAKPVFVDCELETGNIDIEQLEAAIGPKTRGITLVHFAGITVRMDKVMDLARKHDLKVIEDCALALGARYKNKHVGLWGDAGCFSFYPAKHMTTAEGGMFLAKDSFVAKAVSHFRAFSVDRTFQERTVPGIYDVDNVGLNYRMSEIQAAIGNAQVKKLPGFLQKRKENFKHLKNLLAKSGALSVIDSPTPDIENSHYCLVGVLEPKLTSKRNEFLLAMKTAGIGLSVHYPQPVPRLSYYRKKYGYDPEKFKNSERISDASIAFPVGPHLNTEDMATIADCFEKVVRGEKL